MTAKPSIQITGIEELQIRLRMMREAAITAAMDENRAIGADIMAGSQERAPILEGKLIESHRLTEQREANHQTVIVSAGPVENESGEDYSLWMHEGFVSKAGTAHFPYKLGPISDSMNSGTAHVGSGRGWKFLQRSFEVESVRALQRMARAVKTELLKVAK